MAEPKRESGRPNECKKCAGRFMVTGQAFTSYKCIGCGEEDSYPNTGVPLYCRECSVKDGICRRCGVSIVKKVDDASSR